jgi:plastocyanin
MSIRILLVFALTLISLVFIISCAERLTTYEIIGTTTTQQKLDNDAGTATGVAERAITMEATREAGGELDLRPAERAAATAVAEATAAAERGEEISMKDLDKTAIEDTLPAEIPAGMEPMTGEVIIEILNEGYYDPEIVVIKSGTNVIWENTQRTPYGILSDENQGEIFNSGSLRRPLGSKENPRFEHIFSSSGRFTYGPDLSGAAMVAKGRGVIFVVD